MAGTVTIAGLATLTSLSLTDTVLCVGSISTGAALRASPAQLQSGLVMGASGTLHSAGTVPDPGATAGTTHFLREDATWAVPSGAGTSSLAVSQGTLSIGSVGSLTIAGSGGTLSSGGAGQATLTLSTGGVSSAGLDSLFGTIQGAVIYRGASTWTVLAPGSAGQFLSTGGTLANPSWVTGSGAAHITPTIVQEAQVAAGTQNVTMTTAPTQGNMLVAFISSFNNGVTAGTGWVLITKVDGASFNGVGASYKLVTSASEPTLQTPFGGGGTSGNGISIFEVAQAQGLPQLVGTLISGTGSTTTLSGFVTARALVLGQFSQQQPNGTITVSSGATLQQSTSNTAVISGLTVASYYENGVTSAGVNSVTGTVTGVGSSYNTAAISVLVPGV